MLKLQGAIFDLDGTLVDSMHIWNEVPKQVIRRYNSQPAEDIVELIREFDLPEAADFLIKTYSLPCTRMQFMADINELVTAQYRDIVPAKPGVAQLLSSLAQLQVPCAIATASEAFQAQCAMRRLGFWEHFRFALSCSQYGSKTKPDIFLEAARRLGSEPSKTLVFEDALHAAVSAKRAGFLVAGVYDPSADAQREQMRALCDWYLPSLDDEAFLRLLG